MDQGSGWVANLAAISGAKLGAVGGESTDTVGDATPGQVVLGGVRKPFSFSAVEAAERKPISSILPRPLLVP